MKKALGLFILTTRIILPSCAQKMDGTRSDFVTWNKAVIQFNRIDSSRFSAGAEFSYRRINDARAAQLFLGLAFLKYTLPKIDLDLFGTYALVHFYNILDNADLYQIAVGKSFTAAKNALQCYAKLAIDRIIFPSFNVYNRWRYRMYLGAVYPLSRRWVAKTSDEFLLSTPSNGNLPENRAQAGLYVNIGRHIQFGAAYLNRWAQQSKAPNLVENTLLTELIINL